MLRLRKALLCDYLFYIFFVLAILFTIFQVSIKRNSFYSTDTHEVVGRIISFKEKEDYIIYQIKAKEKILVISKQKEKFELGDWVTVEGIFEKPDSYSDRDLWNYQEYLAHQKIYYIVKVESIKRIRKNKNIYFKMKQLLFCFLHNNSYLHTFILGDKSLLKSDVLRSYQENGISHLFALSGMHITLLATILEKIMHKKFCEEKRYKIISCFLIGYLFLVGFFPSIVRGVLFYIIFRANTIYYFYIKKENIFLFIISLSLFMNPFYIFDVGFQYSYLISFALLKMSSELVSFSKWKSLLKVSFLSFVVSIPITLKNYNQLNFLSVFYNLFYVPYVSSIIFPFSLLTFFIRPIEPIYNIFTSFLEKTSLFLSQIQYGKIVWKQLPIFVYWVYLGIILFYLVTKKRWMIYLFFSFLIVHFLIPFLDNTDYVKVLDVGQGDSTLLRVNHKNILIDTGGRGNEGVVYYNILSPSLKKEGINKIHYLILTHGDYDHMGEAINLVENYKVDKVIFNCGEFNDLEQELIKVLDKKRIKYYSCISELNMDDNKLYFLQTKEYDNENDNSNVIYTEIDGYKFMFMGDAGVEKERDILEEYNILDIDVLKVGHHGSETSSSEEFINEMNPKYSIISVGKNNRYGHPNKEVLNTLSQSKICRTDQNGSIMFIIKKNKLQIETCES